MTRALRLYLAGQLGCVTCSWAQVVALSVVAVRLDPALLGWVVAAQFPPSLLVPCVVGALLGGLALMTAGAQRMSLGLIVAGTLLAVFVPTASIVWRFGWRHRRW